MGPINTGVVITLMPIGDVMENQTVDVEFSVEGILEKNITVTVRIVEGKYSYATHYSSVVIFRKLHSSSVPYRRLFSYGSSF